MKGSFGNLPAGEAFLAPVEGGSNGVIVFTSSISGVGICEKPVRVTVENGFATLIEGEAEARILKGLLEPLGKNAFNVAELGIGTNDRAILTGNVLEDEKVLGTVHIRLRKQQGIWGERRRPDTLGRHDNRPYGHDRRRNGNGEGNFGGLKSRHVKHTCKV